MDGALRSPGARSDSDATKGGFALPPNGIPERWGPVGRAGGKAERDTCAPPVHPLVVVERRHRDRYTLKRRTAGTGGFDRREDVPARIGQPIVRHVSVPD